MDRFRQLIRISCCIAAAAGIVAHGGTLPAQTTAPAAQVVSPAAAEIDRLIRQLGDEAFIKREEAAQALTERGDDALPALRAARKDPDAEISQRAEAVIREITDLTPERRAEIASAAAKAVAEADYAAAARQQALLARRPRPTIDECVSAGDDWQLAGEWARAVAAYQRAIERADEVLGGDPEVDPPPQQQGNGFNGRGFNGNGIQGIAGLSDSQRRDLVQRRAGLILLAGRIQRDVLADPAAAVVTFNRILDSVPEFKGDLPVLIAALAEDVTLRRAKKEVPHDIGRGLSLLNEFDILEDLAVAQERLGRVDDAILTLARLSTALIHTRDDGVETSLASMTRLIPKSTAVAELPGAEALVSLTPLPATAPQKKALQVQTFPAGGSLTLDDKAVAFPLAVDQLSPGPHRVAYRAPNHPAVQVAATFKPGRDYALFLSADSPFEWTLTNLGDFGLGPVALRDLAPLPDGRWVAALTAGPRVFMATTRDLVTWDAPQLLPHNAIANNIDPALIVDDAGVIWLAWFNNRFSLQPRSSAGYQLWITHSSDAKTWSPPRAVAADTGGWPMGSLQWFRADGALRLSWRSASATAASPAEITRLDPIEMTRPERMWPMDPHVTRDDAGHFHMVLNDVIRGLSYATSADGVKWSDPVLLIDKPHGGFGEPQLLIDGTRFALFYRGDRGAYFHRGLLADLPNLSPAIQISGTSSVRWHLIGDQIVGSADGESPWLLRAKVSDVFAGQ